MFKFLVTVVSISFACSFVSRPAAAEQQVLGISQTQHAITPEISELANKLLDEGHISGISIGVIHSNDTVELKGWGVKTEDGDEMTPDTLFHIASCSKAFLSASLGILMDDFAHGRNQTPLPSGLERLDWHTKIIDILPTGWKLMDEWATKKANLRDILSHQSGLPRHEFSFSPEDKPLDVIRNMRHLRPAFELRQRWHYNNQMYILASYLISTYSGIPYTAFVKERILDRLNMSSTTFSPAEAAKDGKLTQSWTEKGRRIPNWFTDDEVELMAGAAGIITNTIDLMKWLKVILNEGVDPVTNQTIIPRSTFIEATSAHVLVAAQPPQPHLSLLGYGLGWERQSYQGHEYITHFGAIPGFSTLVFVLPDDGLALVALANGDLKHSHEYVLIYRIIEDFLGLERKESERLLGTLAAPHPAAHDIWPTSPMRTPSTTPLSLPLDHYAGTYYDRGYGNLTLCASSRTPSPACAPVLAAWAHFEDVADADAPVLYAAIPSVWLSHLRLAHVGGDTFVLSGTYLFPHGYGKDTRPFQTSETPDTVGTVDFVVDGDRVFGAAINGFVGELTERQRAGGSINDTAEIWLTKVE